ncbi:hypothetical protein EGT67_07960 [Prescottella agglutinans]|uniref:Uncharacterized protein n=1 Tax=Prescottella agglutinans TaxID=1644129 RepID=A0A3S3AQ36_9NOCA|nr:hypothetical protein [Prescottella agglutinans]RVW10142.1 hypothetical protein EGT67_07960 [Prescottella agglutinans]
MTEPEGDGQAISVAELLARNGQRVGSGAGGRRRRGVKGGISVAELTGEFPAVRNGRAAAAGSDDAADTPPPAPAPAPRAAAPAPQAPAAQAAPQAPASPPVTARTQAVQGQAAPNDPAPRRAAETKVVQNNVGPATVGQVRPGVAAAPAAKPAVKAQPQTLAQPAQKPAVRPAAADAPTVIAPAVKADAPKRPEPVDTGWRSVPPPNSTTTTTVIDPVPPLPRNGEPEPRMLSGQSVAGDLLRQGGARPDAKPADAKPANGKPANGKPANGKPADTEPADDPVDTDVDDAENDDFDELDELETGPSGAKQWAVLLGQGAVALIAGALMFKGFEKLWDMLPMVALVLAVLVIVGLVAMVRILRRTDDVTSLVIALVAGVFVTLGPLAFLLSTS